MTDRGLNLGRDLCKVISYAMQFMKANGLGLEHLSNGSPMQGVEVVLLQVTDGFFQAHQNSKILDIYSIFGFF